MRAKPRPSRANSSPLSELTHALPCSSHSVLARAACGTALTPIFDLIASYFHLFSPVLMSPRLLMPVLLGSLLLPLTSCQKDNAPKPANADLSGTWQLTSRLQFTNHLWCYWGATPQPNETVTFTTTNFTFFANGRPTRHGQYTLVSAVPFCHAGSPPAPTLHLDFARCGTTDLPG